MENQNKAFDDFIYARCEEIINNIPESKELNNSILKSIIEFKKTLSNDQINQFNNIEEKMILLMTTNQYFICKSNINTDAVLNGYKIC